MSADDLPQHLSCISTRWSLVFQAHQGQGGEVVAAQQILMQRYCGAVYRYLLGALRNADAAEELAQEFALRFVRGDFHRATPERGRFRDFVKTALYHLIVDYHRRLRKQPRSLPCDSTYLPATESDQSQSDRIFVERWREELLDRTWEALSALQEQSGQLFYTVLRWRVENPGAAAAQLAERLTAEKGKAYTDVGVRQILHRARAHFATLLLEEVARSLECQETARLEEELIDLGLLSYCRPAFDRLGRSEKK